MAEFFVSYNKADAAVALQIAQAFRDAGISVHCAETDLGIGDDIDQWMMQAIEDSDRCLALFSPEYVDPAAQYSEAERGTYYWQGMNGLRAALVPVLVRDCKMPKALAAKKHHDLRGGDIAALVAAWQNHPMHGKRCLRLNVSALSRPVRGRDSDMQALEQALKTGRAAVQSVVKGAGGVGKSTLARLYIHQHFRDYDGVVWCEAETRNALVQSLLRLYHPLTRQMPPAELTEPQSKALLDMVQERNERWLFVYDNLTKLEDMKGLAPPGDLIVTTRESAGFDGFAEVRPEVLGFATEDDPAVRVLMEAAGRDEDAAGARALAEVLGGLPLALVVAGALIRETGEAFDAYLTQVDKVIKAEPPNAEYDQSLLGAVRLSYDRLSEDARTVADICAWWAPEGLSFALFTGRWPDLGAERRKPLNSEMMSEQVAALSGEETRLKAAFVELTRRSLMTREAAGYSLHRMSAAALRAGQGPEAAQAAVELLAAVYPYDSDHSGNWPLCARLTPHLRALHATGQAPGVAAMDYLLNQGAIYLSQIGDHDGELVLAEASLTMTSARLPETDRDIAVAFAKLGMAYFRQGRVAEAITALRKAVALNRAHYPETSDLADSLDLLGFVLAKVEDGGHKPHLQEAVNLRQEALLLYRRHAGRRSDKVANALNNLGHLRDLQGRRSAAARLHGASLSIQREVLPAGDARLGYVLLNTGALKLKAGAARAAVALLQEGYDLWCAAHAGRWDHEDVRDAADWLISCRIKLGETAEARRLCDLHGFDFEERVSFAEEHLPDPVD